MTRPPATLLSPPAARVAASNAASTAFFDEHAERIARACHAMASRFERGGRLLACGSGAQRSDVAHVVVEFLHPVIVGKRALPALAITDAHALAVVGRAEDILMVIAASAPDAAARAPMSDARHRGMLVLALTGPGDAAPADFHFAVPDDDPCIVQEVHEMLYHVLWELVHVFFERRAVTA